MTNFKERKSPKTTTEVLQEVVPLIGISSQALTKMYIYVQECSDEIGWLGTAYKNESNNTIVIDNVYLFEQDVHGATTEITPDGLSDFAEELLTQGDDGIEIWNNLKMWGHSHVNMGVTPSGQDDSQMKTFKEGGHDWFIRLIANKRGEMKLDLYDYESGVIYLDLPWIEIQSEEERNLQTQIDELYKALDELQEGRVKAHEDVIKTEMKEKVRKIQTQRTTNYTSQSQRANGYWSGGKFIPYNSKVGDDKKKDSTPTKNDSGTSTTRSTETNTIYKVGRQVGEDVFIDDDDVLDMFTNMELIELSTNQRLDDLEEELIEYGYYMFFTENDLERIYRVMRKVNREDDLNG